MIDQTSEIINEVASKKQKNSRGSTQRVAPANGSDLEHQRLEQKKVDDDKPKKEKSGKEKSREFKEQYVKKYADSKSNTKPNKSNIGRPEIGTYSSNQLSQGIQGLNLEAKKRQLFKNSEDKELGE